MFSKTLLVNNLKRFFFLPVIQFISMCIVPMMLYSRVKQERLYGFYQDDSYRVLDEIFRRTATYFCNPVYLMFAAMVTVIAVFSYLYFSKNNYMMHAFPLNRKTLFCTNILTAYLMLVIPTLLALLISLPMVMQNTPEQLGFFGVSYLYALINSAFFVGIATFVVMCTGAIVAVPILYIILNFLIPGVEALVVTLVSPFYFGFSGMHVHDAFSPVIRATADIGRKVTFVHTGEKEGYFPSLLEALPYELIMLALAATFLFAAYFIYQKKHAESSGSLLPMPWTRPVFRVGTAFCGSTVSALALGAIYMPNAKTPMTLLIFFIIVFIVTGIVYYFVIDMMIKRSIHVFTKDGFKRSIIMAAAFVLALVIMYMDPLGIQTRVPDVSEIASMRIDTNGTSVTLSEEIGGLEGDGGIEDMSLMTRIHSEVISQKENIRNAAVAHMNGPGNFCWLNITYNLKNGKTIDRSYQLNYLWDEDSEIADITQRLEDYFNSEKNMMRTIFFDGKFDGKVPDYVNFYIGNESAAELAGVKYNEYGSNNFYFKEEENVKKLMDALLSDYESGDLKLVDFRNGKDYNRDGKKEKDADDYYFGNFEYNFSGRELGENTDYNRHFEINKNCLNVIETFKEIYVNK